MEVSELIAKRKELEKSIHKLVSNYTQETKGFLTKIDVDIIYEEYLGGETSVVRIGVKVKTII